MTDSPIVFGQPLLGREERALVNEVLRSGWIGSGPLVKRFETRLSEYLSGPSVVATSSCTSALQLALIVAGVSDGDEVITTPFTFAATLNAIESVGARPVFVDIDRESLNILPAAVREASTDLTSAAMPVHFGGRPVDVAGFQALAEELDIWVIADAAHAIGARAEGLPVGHSKFDRLLTCFSFYPNKNLASAEGGALVTSDAELGGRAGRIRQHGLDADAWGRYRSQSYVPSVAVDTGLKANWTDLQAAIALPQLEKLEGFLASREYLAARYDEMLGEVPGARAVSRGASGLSTRHALHLYQVEVEDPTRRDGLVAALRREGIGAAVHYIAVHQHPFFERLLEDPLPVADWASSTLVSLPLHPGLSDADLERVVAALMVELG